MYMYIQRWCTYPYVLISFQTRSGWLELLLALGYLLCRQILHNLTTPQVKDQLPYHLKLILVHIHVHTCSNGYTTLPLKSN